jgi:hypothetical protein
MGKLARAIAGAIRLDYSFTYNILVSPMGVQNYIATVKLIPITDGDRFRRVDCRVRLRAGASRN